jgi:hypothetical protein
MMRASMLMAAPMPAFAPVLRLDEGEEDVAGDAGLEADVVAAFVGLMDSVAVVVTPALVGLETPRLNVVRGPAVEYKVKLPPTAWCAVFPESSWIQSQQRVGQSSIPWRRFSTHFYYHITVLLCAPTR